MGSNLYRYVFVMTCRFCFCVLFSSMYPKIKFKAKNSSDLSRFYRKVIFLEVFLREYFFAFHC